MTHDDEAARATLREQCTSAEPILARLVERCAADTSIACLRAQYSSYPSIAERVLVVALAAPTRELADVWMSAVERERLERELRARWTTVIGDCDAMYATPWSVAWGKTGDGGFQVWKPEGRVLIAHQGHLHVGAELVDLASVAAIEGDLSADWVDRSIRLRRVSGRELELVRVKEPIASQGSFIYDGLDLLCDSGWVRALATALGEATGLPVEIHPDL